MSKSTDNPQDNNLPSPDHGRGACKRAASGDGEGVAVPSNTATNNSINGLDLKYLRYGVDSLYLSYQGEVFKDVDTKLIELKRLARSENPIEQAKAQYRIGDHLFEVKDKGSSMFAYVLEDNAFRISLSRPKKAVPMAYVKISSEYLTYKTPEQVEAHLRDILSHLGAVQSVANVSRIDLYLDFSTHQAMDEWGNDAWVTHAGAINTYSIDRHFTGWAVGLGSVIAMRLYDKVTEIIKSGKNYLIPLWQQAGHQVGEPIWRLEFQFKRDFLKQKEIQQLDACLANLGGLWSYATTEWLKLTIPNDADQTRSRWPIHPLWVALASVDWDSNDSPLKSRFKNDRAPSKEACLDRGFSGLTTWMAINGIDDHQEALIKYTSSVSRHIYAIADRMSIPVDELIAGKVAFKARQFNTMNNNMVEEDLDYLANAYRRASDGE
ncbi:replication initiation factor [Methylophilus sp.]|uniref:replication initiation factor n=1 Tax=Methylophilus sp. TaxID=29541 RepID=UPI0040355FC6